MKTATGVLLWVSLGLIVVGLLLAFVGITNGGIVTPTVSKSYEVNEPFSNILIKGDTSDVRFAVSTDGVCRVECVEFEKVPNEVSVKEQTLEINSIDERKWYDHIGFNMGSGSVTVYLPSTQYQDLDIDLSTGDVKIPEGFTFEGISVSLSTGDVWMNGLSVGNLNIEGSTGDVTVCRTVVNGSISVQLSTGDVEFEELMAGAVTISASTGEISLEDVKCTSLSTKNTTSDQIYEDVIVSGDANITGKTSDIKLLGFDAQNIDIETSTGDIFGVLLSEKKFDADTSTGKITLPPDGEGGICKARASTGNIEFRIQ